jgi:hypothetical protein
MIRGVRKLRPAGAAASWLLSSVHIEFPRQSNEDGNGDDVYRRRRTDARVPEFRAPMSAGAHPRFYEAPPLLLPLAIM